MRDRERKKRLPLDRQEEIDWNTLDEKKEENERTMNQIVDNSRMEGRPKTTEYLAKIETTRERLLKKDRKQRSRRSQAEKRKRRKGKSRYRVRGKQMTSTEHPIPSLPSIHARYERESIEPTRRRRRKEKVTETKQE